ncbi:hypothetical protein [Parabacteroides sp. PF5-9]|uniref:hypothetical protein n=1 Tax=Parabacteroides sp. PF5-9 TaxID=1742404 RepID=UPI0024766B1D|nr:hypothetical protein [Parabacteroides sp. PF5-9]
METSTLLSEETLPELELLVFQYPYFDIARLLYLKNLAVLDDPRFSPELKKTAIYIPDRKRLFFLIEGERFGLKLPLSGQERTTSDGTSFSLIDNFLSSYENKKSKEGEEDLTIQSSASSDYIYWAYSSEEPTEEQDSHKLQHHTLIDSFIENEENRTPGSRLINLEEDEPNEESEIPLSIVELEEDAFFESMENSYLTETLARIYIKQKRYTKALQIIKNLSLIYPEKNVYFADQIRFLEMLIINNKK